MSETSAVGIILSAGDSTRMGRPKALLSLDGESFLARIARSFRAAGFDRVAVVVGGLHEAETRRQADDLGIEVIANPDPTDGPISSVRCALEHCSGADIYGIHPVDIPGVDPEDIGALLRSVTELDGDVWIPSIQNRRAHPVLFRSPMAGRILGLPLGSTLRDAWSDSSVLVRHVVLRNRWLLFDVDTERDYETLRRDWIKP